MFTKTDLLQLHKSTNVKPLECLQISRLHRSIYPFIEQESGYRVIRGKITDFDSALQFYCNCLVVPHLEDNPIPFKEWEVGWQGWMSNEIISSLCLPLDVREFQQVLNHFFIVKPLLDLPSFETFVTGLQMRDEWNTVGILAEFQQEYVYIYWHTTG